jgi:hypothetical protein
MTSSFVEDWRLGRSETQPGQSSAERISASRPRSIRLPLRRLDLSEEKPFRPVSTPARRPVVRARRRPVSRERSACTVQEEPEPVDRAERSSVGAITTRAPNGKIGNAFGVRLCLDVRWRSHLEDLGLVIDLICRVIVLGEEVSLDVGDALAR